MTFSLKTGRTILEDMTGGDLPKIQRIARNPEVMRYVLIWLENDEDVAGFLNHAISEAQAERRMQYRLAIRIRQNGAFAGIALFDIDPVLRTTAEVGCILLPEYWKAGYASEILESLLAYGFGPLALHRIFGKCDASTPHRPASSKKAGSRTKARTARTSGSGTTGGQRSITRSSLGSTGPAGADTLAGGFFAYGFSACRILAKKTIP